MSKLIINGGNKLSGQVKIHGAKNSVLPILAATVLCNSKSVIHNCPALSDVYASLNILSYLGCKCNFTDNTVTIDSSEIICNKI